MASQPLQEQDALRLMRRVVRLLRRSDLAAIDKTLPHLLRAVRGPSSGSWAQTAPAATLAVLAAHVAVDVPTQYALGEWDFHELRGLRVRAPVLIPRPETEQLVDAVLAELRQRATASPGRTLRVLDVGTGTGAIALALLQAWRAERDAGGAALAPLAVTAVDISPAAVDLANENAARFAPAEWATGALQNFTVDIRDPAWQPVEPFDVVVSNPPYIASEAMPTLGRTVRCFESHVALDGGPGTGLAAVVEPLLARAPGLLAPGGALWLELGGGHAQRVAVRRLARGCKGVWTVAPSHLGLDRRIGTGVYAVRLERRQDALPTRRPRRAGGAPTTA
jgi:release factor glutamine methyltransferase